MGWLIPSELPNPDEADRTAARAIRCLEGEVAPYVLLPGDPARAKMISEQWLSDSRLVMINREFHTYTGHFRDLDVSVVSTGLGSPGAAMVVQDLARLGVKAAVRVGTAGSGQSAIKPGALVIATGAVRGEGLSRHLIDLAYPAVPDPDLSDAVFEAALTGEASDLHRGVIHTSDAFQSEQIAKEFPRYTAAGVLAYEMEAASIFVKSATLKMPSACIVAIDGFVSNVQSGNFRPDARSRDRAIREIIKIALEGLVIYDSQGKRTRGPSTSAGA